MNIKIYKICKFLYDIKTTNMEESKEYFSSLVLDDKMIESHEYSDEFILSYSDIKDEHFNTILVSNNPNPTITISVSNVTTMYRSKLSISYNNGIYTIESHQSDKYHGYRKELEKELNWENSVESSQLLDILENGRNQIFVNDRILNLLK